MSTGMAKTPKQKQKDYHVNPQINLRLEPDLYDALVEFGIKHKRHRRLVIADAIRDYLKSNAHKIPIEEQD